MTATEKLSDAQIKVLRQLEDGAGQCLNDLKAHPFILAALQRRGYVQCRHERGSLFYPRDRVMWSVTAAGRGALTKWRETRGQ